MSFMNNEITEQTEMSDHSEMAKREVPGMFSGPVLPLIARLSLPVLAGMFFQLLYNIVDTIWVSRIDLNDPSYVGGTGLIFPVIFFFMALASGVSVGVSSLVARAIGEKNRDVLNKIAESGLIMALLLSLICMGAVYGFGPQIVKAMGAEGDYYRHGLNYLLWVTPVALFAFVGNVFFGIFQGEGLMKHMMMAMIIGTVVNIVLDPIFIFTFNLDVRGAAIATGIAQLISLIYALGVFAAKKTLVPISWSIRNVRLEIIKKITVIGLPQALGQITMSISFLLLNRLVVSIDPLAMTAYSLCGRLDQIVLMPSFALAAAMITIVGQNAGRGNLRRADHAVKVGYAAGFIVVLFFALLMMALAKHIYPLFSGIDEVVDYAVRQTYTVELFFSLAVVGIINRSVFQAIGYPMPAFFITMLRVLLISVPAAYLFVGVFDMGVYGVWYGLISGIVASFIVSLIWVRHVMKGLLNGTREIRHT